MKKMPAQNFTFIPLGLGNVNKAFISKEDKLD